MERSADAVRDGMWRGALALVMITGLTAGVASADAIGASECEHGWVWARHGHGGTCEPVLCTGDAQCGGGTCVEVARCMDTQPIDIGDAIEDGPRRTYERPLEALCSSAGTCGGDAHCRRARECAPGPTGGCSVSVARRRTPIVALVSGALMVALLGRDRRRR